MSETESHEPHDHDRGLAFDVGTLMNRRRSLTLLGGAGIAVLAACSSGLASGTSTTTAGDAAACAVIPEETGGPFPGDGSNGVNVLNQSGIVRSDIRSSFGSSSTVAEGVPLIVNLKVLDTANGCTPLVGAAVYIWHCDINGEYSMYGRTVADENYLRGVQETDADGLVTFLSIFPAAYSGRWPHIHFEVYPSVDDATSSASKLCTSQLALPGDVCEVVYASSGYETSVRNLAQTSLDRDNVFSDGYSLQLATVTGSVADGYTASLNVPV